MFTTVVLIVLLCSSLSGAGDPPKENEDLPVGNDIIPQALAKIIAMVTHLKRENQAQARQLRAVEGKLAVRQVAFSASLLGRGEINVGPIPRYITLVYKHVITNIGNGYNPNTGFFTAPVKGAYQFQFYIGARFSGNAAAAVLFKNGHPLVMAYTHQRQLFGSAANGVSLLLEERDVVLIKLWPHSRVFDNVNHHTTFSGHLLFTT